MAVEGQNTIMIDRGGFDTIFSHIQSDYTAVGNVMVKDIGNWSNPSHLTDVNGTLFFTGDDNDHGVELWASDGTESGTTMVKDIVPGSADSSPDNLVNADGTLFFTVDDGMHGTEVWRSDGSTAGSAMIADINPGAAGSSPDNLVDVNAALYFLRRTACTDLRSGRRTGRNSAPSW